MKLKCGRCELEWDYKGKKVPNKNYPIFTNCPRCHSMVKLEELK